MRKPPESLKAPSPELEALLHERARRVSKSSEKVGNVGRQVICFTAGSNRFALETGYVRSVVRAGAVRKLPGAPEFLCGIASHHGRILPVIDLPELLGLSGRPAPSAGELVIAEYRDHRPAFLAEVCEGIRWLRAEECEKIPGSIPSGAHAFLESFTPDGLLVLDAEALLGGSEILIN